MIERVVSARPRRLGNVPVGRILPTVERRMVGPFAFLDHMGPQDLDPGRGVDVPPHPHIGLATVSYLFAGELVHRDSLGVTQPIRPGAVNWMTAGRGIVHSERSDPAIRAAGGPMHGLQAWVALPEADEEVDPSFSHHDTAELPVVEADGVWGRLVAGSALGLRAPAKVYSPLFYLHWELRSGARAELPTEHEERAIYVVRGEVEVDRSSFGPGQLVLFAPGGAPVVSARSEATVMALGGASLGRRTIWWNFVSSRRERIEQAKADWAAGRMALPPGDDRELVPLPDH